MSFDRSKVMRNAERLVAQGKIGAAISEYQQLVEHDPRDFGTLNLLGDLYVKDSNKRAAIKCYKRVAEHYGQQGFAQKAIAIYNKISRLDPDSVEVSAKLAELYKLKGSLSEAKSHYTTLAEHYLSKGWRAEALAMWKQIALLDPNNTTVYVSLAEAYLQDRDLDSAAEAFLEAAGRFSRAAMHDEAVSALKRGLDAKPGDLKCLRELIHQCKVLGRIEEAVNRIDSIFRENPRNRDVARLLIDCHVECGWPEAAESVLIKLVELEPSNYPKFLDLVGIYLTRDDAASASRSFSMCAEHLLMAGKGEEFQKWVSEILAIDPRDLSSLRLSARYYSWKNDKNALKRSLEKLYDAAHDAESVDDERYALSQLVLLIPQEEAWSRRLADLNAKYGFADEQIEGSEFDPSGSMELPLAAEPSDAGFEFVGELVSNGNHNDKSNNGNGSHASPNGNADEELIGEITTTFDGEVVEDPFAELAFDSRGSTGGLSASALLELEKQIEGVTFYIQNGYLELAQKTIQEARGIYGDRPELDEVSKLLEIEKSSGTAGASGVTVVTHEQVFEPVSKSLDLDEIRSEFGLEELDTSDDGDYDTHYQLAIAYQEMGLTEEAIKEYQDAISLVEPGDPLRRFFQCATLLGHCFMQTGMAHLSLTWYRRALETPGLQEEEKHGLWYELAAAFEASGDYDNAARYYEQVYAENVHFRDVSDRIKSIAALS